MKDSISLCRCILQGIQCVAPSDNGIGRKTWPSPSAVARRHPATKGIALTPLFHAPAVIRAYSRINGLETILLYHFHEGIAETCYYDGDVHRG